MGWGSVVWLSSDHNRKRVEMIFSDDHMRGIEDKESMVLLSFPDGWVGVQVKERKKRGRFLGS